MQRLILFSLTFFLVFGCKSQAGPQSSQQSEVEVHSQGKVIKAPDFSLTDLSGEKFSLSEQKGKVVFLDFWATWCPPCVMSVPEVERLVDDYKGKDVVVLSLSLDNSDVPVKRFVKAHNMVNRVAVVGESGVDYKYGVQGIPAFLIIDKQGNVVRGWEGYNSAMAQMWRKEIDRLLAL